MDGDNPYTEFLVCNIGSMAFGDEIPIVVGAFDTLGEAEDYKNERESDPDLAEPQPCQIYQRVGCEKI